MNLALALVVSAPTLAADSGFVGWDKGTVVFTTVSTNEQPVMCGGADCGPPRSYTETVEYVRDLTRDWAYDTYLLETGSFPALDPQADQLDARLEGLAPQPTPASTTSKDGALKAEIVLQGATGAWKGNRFEFTAKSASKARPAKARAYAVLPSGQKALSASFEVSVPKGAIVAYWSPDGRYVAWGIEDAKKQLADMFVGATWGPSVELLLDDALSQTRVSSKDEAGKPSTIALRPKLERQLWAAGVNLVVSGRAQKARETTVIYAAKGFEDAARKLVGSVPGGATVEALTWASPCDVVVAVGSAAAK